MNEESSNRESPNNRSGRKYVDLKTVVAKPWEVNSTVGVIVDATGDYKTDDSFDYVTKLRIMDDRLNPKKETSGGKKGHVLVFIFSPKLASTPNIRKIGSIILLRNFKFDNYKDMVKGYNLKVGSEWQIFDNQKTARIEASHASKSLPSVLNVVEKEAIRRLKDWSQNFLARNSLLKLGWFLRDVKPKRSANELLYKKDIDLIVRVVRSLRTIVNDSVYDRVVFVDSERRLYFSEIKNTGLDFQDNSVVKLRSVSVTETDKDNAILFYNYSKILLLDETFFDARELLDKTKDIKITEDVLVKSFIQEFHLEKYKYDEIAPQTYLYHLDRVNIDLVAEDKKQLLSAYPILMDFDTDEVNLVRDGKGPVYGSCVMKKHSNLQKTSIAELSSLLNKVNKENNKNALKKNLNETFLVEGNISEFKYLKKEEMFRIYSPSSNQTWNLTELEEAQESGVEDLRIIAHNIIFLKEGEEDVPLYIATYDKNPQFLFDVWRVLPDFGVIKDWAVKKDGFKKKMTEFVKCLKRVQKSGATYRFVVQLTNSDNSICYFRVIDSIFWFLSSE